MKILLIQIRPDRITQDHEFDCFLEKSGLSSDDFVRLDVFKRLPKKSDLDGIDGVIVGGSGDYCVSKGDLPEVSEAINKLIRFARKEDVPVMGVCFGAQLMVKALGGKVEMDENNVEMGTFPVTKNENTKKCPVFIDLPETFNAQLGHKDHIVELPKGAVNLASSEKSVVQAFAFPGERVYAITFHPELTKKSVLWRIDRYAKDYGVTPEKRAELSSKLKESSVAQKVLQNFIENVVGKGMKYDS